MYILLQDIDGRHYDCPLRIRHCQYIWSCQLLLYVYTKYRWKTLQRETTTKPSYWTPRKQREKQEYKEI